MSFNADAVTLTLAALVAALFLGILAYASSVKLKAARNRRDIAVIRAAIVDYFRRSGVQVSADCVSFDGNRHFTAVVESEPMKRFRLSHIIEMTLREHIRKTCALELDKIYWRFPIKEATQAVAVPSQAADRQADNETAGNGGKKPGEASDEYINEGLEHYRHIPKPEVTELPWETFEEVATIGRNTGGGDKRDA
ncbi:MAG: hypothetical protein ACREX0_10775 [Noviherbaspirillum sp.]